MKSEEEGIGEWRLEIEPQESSLSNLQSQFPNLGKLFLANQVITGNLSPQRIRNIILLLAASVALMMTGFGIIMPVFARRLGEFGDGVQALGLMTMSFALAQLIASPFMGTFSDRYGRRPLILLSLFVFFATNVGYLFAPSTAVFIAIRAVGGLLTAGLFPASMGVVADIVPEQNRAQWIGIIMGGYGVGFIFGPVLGGFLYDRWGFSAPFLVSAILAAMAFVAAMLLVPETYTHQLRQRGMLRQRREAAISKIDTAKKSFWQVLPRPLTVFGTLLFIDFIGSFAFAFIEPQMIFYMYDQLGWSTTQFGIVVGAYGLAMVFGQIVLGKTSDRYGRRPIILIGTLLSSLLYIGMATVITFRSMLIFAALSGIGGALIAPAASAFYLDITDKQNRGRILGIKESSLALGGVLGPLLVVIAARFMTPRAIFMSASIPVLASAVMTIVWLKEPQKTTSEPADLAWQVSSSRTLAAQAALRGLVLNAAQERQHL